MADLRTTQEYLNTKAGTVGLTKQQCLNKLAGTNGLTAQEAANVYVANGTLLESFQTIGDWTRQSAAGSIAEDTTHFTEGSKSLAITYASGTAVFYDKTLNQVIGGGTLPMLLKVYIPSLTNLDSIALYIASTTNYSKYFSKSINGTALHEGYNYISISPSDWGNTGSESWNNTMLRLRIRISATTGTPSCAFCAIYTAKYIKPKVLITFDDSTESSYTKGYLYMKSLGLKGTNYCIRDSIGTANYLTLAQAQEMYDYGWDLGNHGSTNLTTIATQAEQETEIAYNEVFLTTNGFIRANKHYAYPNGGYNDNAKLALAALGYKTARTIIDRTQGNYLDDSYLLIRQGIYHTTTVATAKGYIDNCIARGDALILNFHVIVDSTADVSTKVLTASFNEIMDYIKTKVDAGLIDVLTISEWYQQVLTGKILQSGLSVQDALNIKANKSGMTGQDAAKNL